MFGEHICMPLMMMIIHACLEGNGYWEFHITERRLRLSSHEGEVGTPYACMHAVSSSGPLNVPHHPPIPTHTELS